MLKYWDWTTSIQEATLVRLLSFTVNSDHPNSLNSITICRTKRNGGRYSTCSAIGSRYELFSVFFHGLGVWKFYIFPLKSIFRSYIFVSIFKIFDDIFRRNASRKKCAYPATGLNFSWSLPSIKLRMTLKLKAVGRKTRKRRRKKKLKGSISINWSAFLVNYSSPISLFETIFWLDGIWFFKCFPEPCTRTRCRSWRNCERIWSNRQANWRRWKFGNFKNWACKLRRG